MRTFKTVYDIRKENERITHKKTVESAFEFVTIGEIDTMNEFFQAEVIIESKWMFNEAEIEREVYDPKKHWNPKLYIENAKNISKEEITYEINVVNGVTFINETRLIKGIIYCIYFCSQELILISIFSSMQVHFGQD